MIAGLVLCVAATGLAAVAVTNAASHTAADRPSQRIHHFVSPDFITTNARQGTRVVLGNVTKSPKNPLLKEGLSPWDMAWWNTYPTVIFDPNADNQGLYKLWYNALASCGAAASTMCPSTDYPNRTHPPITDRKIQATLYAESPDGLEWTRPALGQVGWPDLNSSKANNIAIDAGSADPNRGVYLDTHESDPARRYKAFGSFTAFNNQSIGRSKLGIVSSPDGKAWNKYTPVDEMQVSADTANNLLYDPDLDMYMAFTRKWIRQDDRIYGGRREYRSLSKTIEGPWSVATEVGRGEAGYELYALLPWRDSSWVPGVYFAIGSFYADSTPEEKVYCELMYSTSYGENWTRLAPHTPFIPLGDSGSFDDHTCYSARPFTDPSNNSSTRFYYAGGNGPHSGARSDFMALATAPTNALAGLLWSAATPITLRSQSVVVTGKQLYIHAETIKTDGEIHVEVHMNGTKIIGAPLQHQMFGSHRRSVQLEHPLVPHSNATVHVTLIHAAVYSIEFE